MRIELNAFENTPMYAYNHINGELSAGPVHRYACRR